MATQEQIEAIAGLYVAYFDRAPDPAGLNFWINQLDNGRDFTTISQDFATSLEAQDIYPFLANPDLATTSPAAFVTSIYANLFGRAPEQAGLDFWVAQINDGKVLPGDMVEAVMLGARNAVINGEFVQDKTTIENKIECALEFTNSVMAIEDYVFDNAAYEAARQAVDGIDASPESVAEAKLFIEGYVGSFLPVEVFTACIHEVEISPAVVGELVTKTEIYWGYNPHPHDETSGVDNLDGNDPNGNDNNLTNEGPEDGGIPAEAFFGTWVPPVGNTPGFYDGGYLQAITGASFFEMAEFDLDVEDFPVPDFSNLRDITVTSGDAGTGGVVTFHYSDGSSDDIAIGTEYFAFLHDLIFDEEGNSRFFEKEVAVQVPVFLKTDGSVTTDRTEEGVIDFDTTDVGLTPIGYVDAFLGAQDAVKAHLPMILTTNVNNGGTYERGFTTDENDLIQVGQLQLLHGAIIDAGGGYNTLEVDAKGHFAQPKALQNIQQITVTALPNVYTDGDDPQGTEYPDLSDGSGPADSILDLTRATELENLTIAEGDYDGSVLEGTFTDGDLVVTGMRNDATLTLQGAFENGVTVRAGPGITGDGFTVHLQNVNFDDDSGGLDIAQNSPKLNLVSEGGANHIADLDADGEGNVRELVITGEAHLFIQSDLSAITEEDTPVIIDASGNEGGVDLNISSVEQVTFLGSTMDDRFAVDTANSDATDQGIDFNNDQSVVINNALGDNYYDIETYALELNDGDGDGNVELLIVQGEVTLGDGDNHVEGQVVNLVASAGDGDNKFDIRAFDSPQTGPFIAEDDFPTLVDLTAGDGSNIFNVFVDSSPAQVSHFLTAAHVNITAGDGGNLIQVPALPFDLDGYDGEVPPGVLNFLEGRSGDVLSTVEVNTGSGDDSILVGGSTITVNSGGGDDTITLLGIDNDYVTEVASLDGFDSDGAGVDYGYSFPDPEDGNFNYKGFIPSIFGATLDIDTGSGSATINLGAYFDDAFGVSGAIVAKEGSVITGNDITLFVNTHADLRAADLNGITSIVLDDDKYGYGGQGFPAGSTAVGESASLTLLDTQFIDLGQDVFSTQGETFGAQSTLTIIITSDTTLSQLIDFSSWNDSVKLCFVVEDGSTLTLSAEELHKYVAPDGIAVDESNAYIDNQVVVTDAGFLFDPFNDQFGGTGGGTIAGSLSNQDIDIIYTPDGYERPSQDPSTATISIDSDVTPVVENVISPFANKVVIEGNADLEITGRIDLANNFEIDFSDFAGDFIPENAEGTEIAFTIYNFQELTDGSDPYDWGRIDGNGTSADPVRINIVMQDGTMVGDADLGVDKGGIHTSGVQEFMFTGFVNSLGYDVSQAAGGTATVVVCDKTEDLEVLGLQNNRNAEITFEQVNWGTEILLEGDGYANASDQEKNLGDPDYSEVGCVKVNFFEPGANAFVRLTNQGVELGMNEDAEDGFDPDGERVLEASGIIVNNADRLLIQVEDGDAIINDVTGPDVERVIINSPEDVTITIGGVGDLPETMVVDGETVPYEGDKGDGLDESDLVSIDGSGVGGTFTINLTGSADLGEVDLVGVDAICLEGGEMGDPLVLTLTADQVVAYGALIESKEGSVTQLNVEEMADQPIDMASIDVDAIGTVTFVQGEATVDPSTNFGGLSTDADAATGATLLVIPPTAEITMTNEQFETANGGMAGATPVVNDGPSATPTPAVNQGTLILTISDPGDATEVDVKLDMTAADVDVDIVVTDLTLNEDWDVSATGAETTTLVLAGVTDISAVPVPAGLGTVDCIEIADGADVTISEDQLQTLLAAAIAADPTATLDDIIKMEDGAFATLNIVGIDGGGPALDLGGLVEDYPGLNIGTLTTVEDGGTINLDPSGAMPNVIPYTLGGADEVVILDDTILNLTQDQFVDQTLDGTVSGDGTLNLVDVYNNEDNDTVTDTTDDTALIDTSNVTANRGTITFLELDGPDANTTVDPLEVGERVILNEATDVSGFEIQLSDGQLIGFWTEDQASGAAVTDIGTNGNPTGIIWIFESVSQPVDTANYDSNIETLFVSEILVNGANEEDLWTLLQNIDVEKFGGSVPLGLIPLNRVNIFEAYTAAPDGITFDDTNEFQTIANLTIRLEGGVNLGDVTIDDTNGEASFETLTINSYFDPSSLSDQFATDTNNDGINDTLLPGFALPANEVGDIFINIAQDPNIGGFYEGVRVTITTNDFTDPGIANGISGTGNGTVIRDGQAIEVGTIFLGTPGPDVNSAAVQLIGDNDISIMGFNTDDPNLQRVDIRTATVDLSVADVVFGTVNIDDLADDMGLLPDELDTYIILDDFTAVSTTDFNPGGFPDIIVETRGDVDLKEMGAGPGFFNVDGIFAATPGTISLTGAQLAAIGIAQTDADAAADNWVLGPGVNPGDVTINICDLDTTTGVDLDAIAAAGFNIGTITITTDQELHPDTTLGGADNIVIELGGSADPTISLEMTGAQFQGFSGIITETIVANPVNPDPDFYEGQVIVDQIEALEEGTDPATVDIDLSQVSTTGDNAVMLSDNAGSAINAGGSAALEPDATPVAGGDGDVILADTALLGNFQVHLNDVDSNPLIPNELAGQTIRFAVIGQADGRDVVIFGAEATNGEQDTNVVWLFDTIPGPLGLDVSGYDDDLGRVWVSDDLVDSVGGDIDLLFTIDDPDNPGTPLFTLDEAIIKRIESGDLTDALNVATPIDQNIEVVAGATLGGILASIIDPVIFIENLNIDLGGLTNNGNLDIDNILGVTVLGDDDFDTLTLNSYIADFYNSDTQKHYLLPDSFDADTQVLPTRELQFGNAPNVFGDIQAGGNRGVLDDVVINTGNGDALIKFGSGAAGAGTVDVDLDVQDITGAAIASITLAGIAVTDTSDSALVAEEVAAAINAAPGGHVVAVAQGSSVVINNTLDTDLNGDRGDQIVFGSPSVISSGTVEDVDGVERGTDFVAQTIFLSEDDTPEDVIGTITLTGTNDVTVKGIDATDAEILVSTMDTSDFVGTYTATGGSAAWTGGNTERLIFTNDSDETGLVGFGGSFGDDPATVFSTETDFFNITEVGGQVQAGIDGEALSLIDTSDHGGTINLGIVSRLDGTGLNSANTPGFNPADGFDDGFQLINDGTGTVILCLGTAETTFDGLQTPTLSAGGEWTFDGPGIELEIKDAVLEGTLNLIDVDLCISGDVDFSDLEALNITGGTIEVKAGAKLTLTVEQVDALQDALGGPIIIFGEGEVCVEGESDSSSTDAETDFANLHTATVNLSAVTLAGTDDGVLQITARGAMSDDALTDLVVDGERIAQTIIGSDNDDAVTLAFSSEDGDADTIDVITRLGADSGDIGVPEQTPSTNTPDDLTPEVQGDTVTRANIAISTNVQIEVDEGFDSLIGTGFADGIRTGDVVQVASGAEFYAEDVGGAFIATSDSSNDGIAVIEDDSGGSVPFDVSAAGGTMGWTLIGGPDGGGIQNNAIVGSVFSDMIIDGTADNDENDGEEDTFTGGAEADTFYFGVERSEVATADLTVVADGADFEEIDVDGTFSGSTLRFEFVIGAIDPAFVTIVDPGADFATEAGIATALAAAINARPDATATVVGDVVTARGIDGRQFDLVEVRENPSGANTDITAAFTLDELADNGDYADDPTDPEAAGGENDDRTEVRLDFSGTPDIDEEYTITIRRSDGSEYEGTHTVLDTGGGVPETLQAVVDALALSLNLNSGGDQLFYSVGTGAVPGDTTQSGAAGPDQIIGYDTDQTDGGFTVELTSSGSAVDATSSVIALGSSSILDGGETLLDGDDGGGATDGANADSILDFVSGTDKIDFAELPTGDGSNFTAAAQVADFATALAAASLDFSTNGTTYFYTSTAADGGMLFYDVNADGDADGVVGFVGLGDGDFVATDIA